MDQPADLSTLPIHECTTQPPEEDRPTLVDPIGFTVPEALTFILARVEDLRRNPYHAQYHAAVETFHGRLLRMQGAHAKPTVKDIFHYTEPFLKYVESRLEGLTGPFLNDACATCAQIRLQLQTLKPSS